MHRPIGRSSAGLRDILRAFSILTFVTIVFFFSETSLAGPARAQWTDSTHIVLKFAQGVRFFNDMHFFLAETLLPNSAPSIHPLAELPVTGNSGNTVNLSTSQLSPDNIDNWIRKALKIYVTNSAGQILDSTAIQYAGLLDQLYVSRVPDLGVSQSGQGFNLRVWAPTAAQVRLFLYANSSATSPDAILPMQRSHGVWSASLSDNYQNYFYLYEVQVYQPLTDKTETSLVTDPYSISIAINGSKSQIIDPEEAQLKPSGWDQLQKPELDSPKDAVIYELHIRDYTVDDRSLPFMYRGTYGAFQQSSATSIQHLHHLAQAGLTHVHIMPFNHFATVNEDSSQWQNYTGGSTALEEPQEIIGRIRNVDPYNWGYDPVHFMVPEGSYAVQPDGNSRVREVREMVQGLSNMGLRIVQDVVFNHTYKNGLEAESVFDKIVPLYYYRVTDEGDTYNSSCCSDTASEHAMMERLMIDSVVFWARTYKIDGFRFDLMSFHTHETMIHLREALRRLTLENDGVDGSKILIYGEGWTFGSLFDMAPNASMNLLNSYGLGIGFFNDRLRDAVRGGTTNSSEKSDQGFVTGLYYDFNQEPANRNTPPDLNGQREKLLQLGDVIKVGLTGNLRDYVLRDYRGYSVHGGDLDFRGDPVGTTAQAIEDINYVSAHDGYTLWDAIQAKAPFYTNSRTPGLTSVEEKQRIQQMALAFPLLGQGIPFLEAGTEILRSKCGDQDSYDSGDFFNEIDWSGQDNRWGQGLPPAWRNYDDWSFWEPRLQDPAMKITPDLIQATDNYVLALLRLRQSEPLFKLNTLAEISQKLQFIDNDQEAQPGLIAMHLHDSESALLVLFNAARNPRTFTHPLLKGAWSLHPALSPRVDPMLAQVQLNANEQSILIPGRTTVVLKAASESIQSSSLRRRK